MDGAVRLEQVGAGDHELGAADVEGALDDAVDIGLVVFLAVILALVHQIAEIDAYLRASACGELRRGCRGCNAGGTNICVSERLCSGLVIGHGALLAGDGWTAR